MKQIKHILFKSTCVKRTQNNNKNLPAWPVFWRMRSPNSAPWLDNSTRWGGVGCSPWFCLSLYLISQQSRNTRFWGITNGGQVMASFEGQDDATPGQAHQLLRQVPKACNEGKEEMQEKGKGCGWNQAPGKGSKNYRKELHHIKKPQGIWKDSTHNISQVGF